jgi:hypothetical protein
MSAFQSGFNRRAIAVTMLCLLSVIYSNSLSAQANVEVFGQNRVQYRQFPWKFFDTKHFRIYHYDRSGVTLARYVSEQAERDIALVEQRMSGTFPKRFNIVLYNSYDEYRQSNIGLRYDNQIEGTATGTVDIVGDKLVVYFNGVHTDLRRQIRAGMSQVVLQRSLFGENFREVVKNSLLLNLPAWVSQGYIAYLVDGWDAAAESALKNELSAFPNTSFYTLAERKPELAGKAFWKWVADKYGDEVPKTLLYAMQVKSSLNQGVKMTLGMKVIKAYDSCVAWYKTVFAADSLTQETPLADSALLSIAVPKDNGVIKSIRVSPRGQDVAYCLYKEGEYFIYMQKTADEQVRSLIMQEGAKDWNEQTSDPDYPLLAWSTNGYKLAIMYRRKTETRLRIYNSQQARIENYIIPPNRFDRVTGLAFNEDNDQIIFSAIRKSQTDLYSFTLKGSRLTNITNDVWDDIQPQFISGGSRRGILFLSNRPAPNMNVPAAVNELPTGPMNVYFYDTKTQSPELLQCSYNKSGNLSQPIQYGADNFAFLLDTNGVQNKYVVTFVRKGNNYDSAVPVPVTNYSRSILTHQYNAAANQVADVLQMGDHYKVFFGPLLIPGKNAEPKTLQPTLLRQNMLRKESEPQSSATGIDGSTGGGQAPVLKRGTTFQNEFGNDTSSAALNITLRSDARRADRNNSDTDMVLNPLIKDSTYLKLKSQNYRLSFKPDFFQARLDNTVLFTQYQSAGLHGGQFANPSLGGLISISLTDALENHKFTGGIRLPVDFSGMTYFLQYQNFTRRIDWGAIFLRTANYYNYIVTYADSLGRPLLENEQQGKVTTNMLQGNVGYPLDRRRRIGATLGLRQDVLDFKAEDTLSLTFSPQAKTYWIMSRLEYVFDNSIMRVTNIREGFRWKAYGEYLYGLSGSNKGGFFNLGVDFRYYKRLYRNSIFAFRFATAHSEGDQNVRYFMGGVDGWIRPKPGVNTAPVTDQNYAFQTLSTPLRGYGQNARNGSSFGLINMEVRVPILSTLMRRPIQSTFLRNLQLCGFTDAGSAWNGWVPNSNSTSQNFPPISSPNTPVTLQVRSFQAGELAMGYGAGLRSTLLGYFLRVDAAWNIEGLKKPMWYVAIGLDF